MGSLYGYSKSYECCIHGEVSARLGKKGILMRKKLAISGHPRLLIGEIILFRCCGGNVLERRMPALRRAGKLNRRYAATFSHRETFPILLTK